MRRLFISFLLSYSFNCLAQPVSPDLFFGNNGYSLFANPSAGLSAQFEDAAVQKDGKIVAVGRMEISTTGDNRFDFLIVRYNTDGSLDHSFGNNGAVLTDFGLTSDDASCIAIQPDGKIVVAGRSQYRNFAKIIIAVARYNANGALDATFGDNGRVKSDFSINTEPNAIAIQKDGKIVLGGHIYTNAADFLLVRYLEDGTLDQAFGSGGKVTKDFNNGFDAVAAVSILDDGRIIAAGDGKNVDTDFTLIRFQNNGTVDNSFGNNGVTFTNIGVPGNSGADNPRSMVFQSDGKIVLGGWFRNMSAPLRGYEFALTRYSSNGILDPSFGQGGIVTLDFGPYDETASSLAIQPNGKILIGGSVRKTNKPPNQFGVPNDDLDFAIARYNTNGTLDSTFGNDGKLTSDFRGASNYDSGEGISELIINENKFYAIGSTTLYEKEWGNPGKGVIAAYRLDDLLQVSYSCPPDTLITLPSCDATTTVTWPIPRDSFPGTIPIPSGVYPDGSIYYGEGRLTLLGTLGSHGYYRTGDAYQSYSRTQANTIATSVGGHLTTITSGAENDFVLSKVQSTGYFSWIGMQRTGTGPAQFSWVTGEPLNYTNWGGEDPNNGGSTTTIAEPYVFMYEGWGTWHDLIDYSLPFQVEYDAAPIRWRQISGPLNGSSLGAGVYPVCYERFNAITNQKDTCCFTITVQCSPPTVAAMNKQIAEEALGFSVKALPNPSATSFILQLNSSNKERISVRVTDMSGRLIEARDGVAANATLQLGSTYYPGTYLVHLVQGIRRTTLKLVKQPR